MKSFVVQTILNCLLQFLGGIVGGALIHYWLKKKPQLKTESRAYKVRLSTSDGLMTYFLFVPNGDPQSAWDVGKSVCQTKEQECWGMAKWNIVDIEQIT